MFCTWGLLCSLHWIAMRHCLMTANFLLLLLPSDLLFVDEPIRSDLDVLQSSRGFWSTMHGAAGIPVLQCSVQNEKKKENPESAIICCPEGSGMLSLPSAGLGSRMMQASTSML
ncbi:hypothetical protein BJV74DRAFT_861670 [Russula compacta]|nr:hypothetical protein BJV74DRAFT_861670 [Russula compacta]